MVLDIGPLTHEDQLIDPSMASIGDATNWNNICCDETM
jgi:hypothetical protein